MEYHDKNRNVKRTKISETNYQSMNPPIGLKLPPLNISPLPTTDTSQEKTTGISLRNTALKYLMDNRSDAIIMENLHKKISLILLEHKSITEKYRKRLEDFEESYKDNPNTAIDPSTGQSSNIAELRKRFNQSYTNAQLYEKRIQELFMANFLVMQRMNTRQLSMQILIENLPEDTYESFFTPVIYV
jgi:hypothetical protein